jgi:hypothetical protein
MLFYAYCIELNKYKYNYGRRANRTLKDLLIPEEMPLNLNGVAQRVVDSLREISLGTIQPNQNLMKKANTKRDKNDGGLSDEKLVKKYEPGEFDFGIAVGNMLNEPSRAIKSEKQKAKS